MPTISVRVSDETHDQIKQKAEAQGLSLSDFLRAAVEQVLTTSDEPKQSADVDVLQHQLREKGEAVQFLRQELKGVRQSAEDAAQRADEAKARSDTIILQLTQQLDRTQLQLEDLREKEQRSFWHRLMGKSIRLKRRSL